MNYFLEGLKEVLVNLDNGYKLQDALELAFEGYDDDKEMEENLKTLIENLEEYTVKI